MVDANLGGARIMRWLVIQIQASILRTVSDLMMSKTERGKEAAR